MKLQLEWARAASSHAARLAPLCAQGARIAVVESLQLLDALALRFGDRFLQLEIELGQPLVFEREQPQRLLQRRDIRLVLEACHDCGH